jgi:hypothetical protein
MRSFKHWVLVIALLAGCYASLKASHVWGVDATYSCVNPCTVRVHWRMYGDCTNTCYWGIWLQWRPTAPGCTVPPPITNVSPQVTYEITPICATAVTRCTTPGALINGVLEYYWFRDYDICAGSPCVYEIKWEQCCRFSSVQSVVNPGSNGIFNKGTLINTAVTPCNNSPQFNAWPVTYFCSGQDHEFSVGAYDVDGDSLVYELGNCYKDSVNTVDYAAGYSALQPLGPTWGVSIDAGTGILRFDANPGNAMTALICVYVKEYRNGVLIGQIMRDMMVQGSSCGWYTAPTWTGITNVTGGAWAVGDDIYLCGPGSLCFDIGTMDLNPSQNLMLTWDAHLPGGTFVSTVNATIQDTISGTGVNPPAGRLCWTAPVNGTYYCRLRIQDDACPIFEYADKVITLHVGLQAGTSSASAGLVCASGFTADFMASGCGNGPFTYTWSRGGGLGSSAASFSHTYAAPGTYAWQVVISDGMSVQDTFTGSLTVTGQPAWQGLITGNTGLDSCAGIMTNTLGAGAYSGYSWSTGSMSPLITVGSPGYYGVTVTDGNGCQFQDTATVGFDQVDIQGLVRTSLGGFLQGQKVYLIQHDTALQALWAIDSVITDAWGYYQFCNVTDTLVFIKAAPDSSAYPNEMPTYASLSLYWNNAITFYPLTQVPFVYHFSTLNGVNPGGPGFIGGLISQGANKVAAVGDPVPGVRVFLRNRVTGAVLGYRDSDVNGCFSFSGVPLGDYEIVPDRENVSVVNVPGISLTAQAPVRDSLDFQLHRYWLELVQGGTGVLDLMPGFVFHVAPNPFTSGTQVVLEWPGEGGVEVDVLDMTGRNVERVFAGKLVEGRHEFVVGETLAAGSYFVRVRTEASVRGIAGQVQVIKVIKVE